MARKRYEQTSKEVASEAGKLLGRKATPKNVKRVAASALTQAPNRGRRRRKK